MNRKFDLQLFADEIISQENPVQEAVVEQQAISTEATVETPAGTPIQEEKPQLYTVDEFQDIIADEGIEKLDPNRLPEEVKPYYKSMLRDYRAKTAQVKKEAELYKQLPQPEQINRKEVITKYATEAMATTKNLLDMQPDDVLDMYDPMTSAAYNMVIQGIIQRELEQNAKQARLNEFDNSFRESDPDYDNVFAFYKSNWQHLPAEYSAAINEGVANPTPQNLKRIEKVYGEIKKAYLEKQKPKQKITKEPPVTVQPQINNTPSQKRVEEFDPTALSSFSADERAVILGKVRRGEAVWKSKG